MPAKKFTFVDYFLFDGIISILSAVIYFTSLIGPFYLISRFWDKHPAVLLLLVMVSYLLAVVCFLLATIFIVGIFLLKKIPEGRFFLTSKKVIPWSIAVMVNRVFLNSPFAGIINRSVILRPIFYRGMGAKLFYSSVMDVGVKITDPWAVSLGRDVLIGLEAVITCHKIERDILSLEPVEIGDNVLIGARSHIMPGVKIGNNVVVGAESLVPRGTIIPDGEVWSGNPAKKVDLLVNSFQKNQNQSRYKFQPMESKKEYGRQVSGTRSICQFDVKQT